ncbi:DoxX family protein [Streptomyces fuscichromogenes]|uniref:DoxX family protein n=1 Tax=Streptomyces fuscichromogenes TaxID=1324013 RepID=UPI001E52521C|nr:DoxX family protein [Streptomyces fuscichromogenes]
MAVHEPTKDHGKNLARLLLRAALGGTMVAHGLNHGRSLDGTARWFGSIGFSAPKLQARASAVVETAAGVALVAGAGTPLAAAAVVGTMGVAGRAVHQRNGFFVNAEGYEYVLNVAIAATALAALGPGRWSVDRALRADRRLTGVPAAAVAAGLGIAAASAQLAAFWNRPAPAEKEVDAHP